MDDIPKGAFICTYAGLLLTEEQSDIRGAQFGDEYFAELDFLQCLTNLNNETDQMDESSSNDLEENSNWSTKSGRNKASAVATKLNETYQRPKQQASNRRKGTSKKKICVS